LSRYYGNKLNVNIKITSMYNILCNKQDKLFSSTRLYLHKRQGSPNEFKKDIETI
jgi:hypothetical protein